MDYRLDVIPILDAKPRRFVLAIAGTGFETLEGLHSYVEGMPKGSVIVLDPGCHRFGGEPLLESEKEMAAFESHCKSHGVTLRVIPSG